MMAELNSYPYTKVKDTTFEDLEDVETFIGTLKEYERELDERRVFTTNQISEARIIATKLIDGRST